jgi:superoxide dismutase
VTPSITNYLNSTAVKYAGNNTAGLAQILTQKYLAFFQNSGLEAYYNQRRTDIPEFREGTGTGNNGVIPKRWLYPSAEETTNNENLSKAIESQFGSMGDSRNAEIYIIKD